MHNESFARAEAFLAGLVTCLVEIVIWDRLAEQGRTLHYYHPIPMAAGLLLIVESQLPRVDWISLAATLFAFVTSMNMYNTFYVHVVTLQGYVEDVRNETLLDDLFLPRYRDAFYPWGPVAQTLYALMVIAHCTYRAYVTAHVLRLR